MTENFSQNISSKSLNFPQIFQGFLVVDQKREHKIRETKPTTTKTIKSKKKEAIITKTHQKTPQKKKRNKRGCRK